MNLFALLTIIYLESLRWMKKRYGTSWRLIVVYWYKSRVSRCCCCCFCVWIVRLIFRLHVLSNCALCWILCVCVCKYKYLYIYYIYSHGMNWTYRMEQEKSTDNSNGMQIGSIVDNKQTSTNRLYRRALEGKLLGYRVNRRWHMCIRLSVFGCFFIRFHFGIFTFLLLVDNADVVQRWSMAAAPTWKSHTNCK